MDKYKMYISIILLLVGSYVGINTLLDNKSNNINAIADSIADSSFDIEKTTTTTTEEITTTTTSSKTTTVPITTTTKRITTTVNKSNNNTNTLSISNSNKIFNLKKDDGSGKIISNGNSYGMIDNRVSFNDRKMIIYGHSYNGGGGYFNYFQNYDNNKAFYDSHKYITVNYNNKNYTYEIFSVYIVTASSDDDPNMEYYNWYKYNNVMWDRVIKEYKNKSQYNTGVEVNGNDRILIIQTCSTNPSYSNKYYISNLLVMAKLIKEE